jgi:hypothetical protein
MVIVWGLPESGFGWGVYEMNCYILIRSSLSRAFIEYIALGSAKQAAISIIRPFGYLERMNFDIV